MWTHGLALLAVLAALPAAARRPHACPPERYVVRGGVPLVGGAAAPPARVVALEPGRAVIEGACGAAKLRRRVTRKGAVLSARWRRCGARRRVVLRALFPRGGGCAAFEGTLRAHRTAPARFHAGRSACGDGVVDPARGETCEASGSCGAGLVCVACGCVPPVATPTSTSTTSTLVPVSSVCGNGVREPGEACDGDDLAGFVCPEGGTAACAPDCVAVDQTGCFRCGNGVREGAEECDQVDFGGATCDAPGETGGVLTCTNGTAEAPGCRIDRGSCWRCGNGRVDPGEQCDRGPQNGADGVGCTAECATRCGDGLLQDNEECDDADTIDGDGCSALCRLENGFPGGAQGDSGPIDACMLDWAVWGLAPGATNACADGTACDRDGTADGACVFRVGVCANVGQSPDGGPVACRPSDVARVALALSAALDAAERAALLDALAGLLGGDGGTVSRADDEVAVEPPYAAAGRCAQLDLTVAAGATAALAVDGADSAGAVDADRLDFVCLP